MTKLRLTDLYSSRGTLDRGSYFAWGCLLLGIKYNLDRFILSDGFGRKWSVESYFGGAPQIDGLSSTQLTPEYAALFVASLPFLWVGIILSLRRIRAIGWPGWLAVLFVIPYLKWLLFAALSTIPSRPGDPPIIRSQSQRPTHSWIDRIIPTGLFGSAVLAVVTAVFFAVTATVMGTYVWENYGWALFLGVPFLMGHVATVVFAHHESRSLGECLAVAMAAAGLAAAAVLILAFEGFICIAMAAPIVGAMAALGGATGYAVQARKPSRNSPSMCGGALLALPFLVGVESWHQPEAPLLRVTSVVEINAPREVVWRHVVSFSDLPPPNDWLFRTGIAYPVRATIDGRGTNAIRHCEFSTGAFIEPITEWDEPRLLRFSVTHNPAPMQEWTFYNEIHPPHLDGFLASESGEFRLIEVSKNQTRLEGTTWYRHHMAPVRYWQLWSDFIIHRIHMRVLRHIARLAEGKLEQPTPR